MSDQDFELWNKAMMAPWQAVQAAAQNIAHAALLPVPMAMGGGMPGFMPPLSSTRAKGNLDFDAIKGLGSIQEDVALRKPFCQVRHFVWSPHKENAPKVLLFAPMNGHGLGLLQDFITTLLPAHDVYATDWTDAASVSLAYGKFDLAEAVSYALNFIGALGPLVHVVAIGDMTVPVLTAVSLLAEQEDPAQPSSLTLISGPINTQIARTNLTGITADHPVEWFEQNFTKLVPFFQPGGYRAVFPGSMALQSPIAPFVQAEPALLRKQFDDLTFGDGEKKDRNDAFFKDVYLATRDVPAEYYLSLIEHVYQNNELANRTFRWRNRLVKPELIRRTALLTIEGDLDNVTPPPQTRFAHELCEGLSDSMKLPYMQIGVGRYSVIRGRIWRETLYPVLRDFIQNHLNPPTQDVGVKVPDFVGEIPHA